MRISACRAAVLCTFGDGGSTVWRGEPGGEGAACSLLIATVRFFVGCAGAGAVIDWRCVVVLGSLFAVPFFLVPACFLSMCLTTASLACFLKLIGCGLL